MKCSQLLYGLGNRMSFNAGNKAVEDISKIAFNSGFSKIFHIKRSSNKIIRVYRYISSLLMCLLTSDRILIQYPITNAPRIDRKLTKIFLDIFKRNIVVVVHDLNSYRFTGILDASEIKFLNCAKYLFVHTSKMKEFLIGEGIPKEKMAIIGAFPYLVKKRNNIDRTKFSEIVFAGNLEKSKFLQPLTEYARVNDIKINLYGCETDKISYNENVKYMGRFTPDDVSDLRGKWGLVWDGESLDTCSGNLGQYMSINSPHKVSLYVAAELPIVIWDGSALASYITNNNLGITFNSFDDLLSKISKVTESLYLQMVENVKEYSLNITNGIDFKNLLNTTNQ